MHYIINIAWAHANNSPLYTDFTVSFSVFRFSSALIVSFLFIINVQMMVYFQCNKIYTALFLVCVCEIVHR